MSHLLHTIGKATNVPVKHFVCDEDEDLAKINTLDCPMGSTCYVIETGTRYMLNSKGEWKLFVGASSGSGGEGGGGDTPNPDDTIIYDGGTPYADGIIVYDGGVPV